MQVREAQRAFVMKFQQCTSPIMAKGVEDTAFYIYNRLVSLNEVGGAPEHFGVSLAAFHEHNQARLRRWPHSMLATSTHDTKRSEDVRARINVLSEMPDEWQAALRRWSRRNKKKKLHVDGQPTPSRNEEYLFYQTLLGAWPLHPMTTEKHTGFTRRMQEYMRKATKEAKENTSWINPNQTYDDALEEFVRAVLNDSAFLEDFHKLSATVTQCGMYNSLAQTLVKLTVPGVPDIYQGNELWDFSLVDPDNRRPVDYARRRSLLQELQARLGEKECDLVSLTRELLDTRADGRIKLYVTHRTLLHRRAHPDLFLSGDYLPIEVNGPKRNHVCAFARRQGQQELLVAVPRFFSRLIADGNAPPLGPAIWGESWLSLPALQVGRKYRNLFTGEMILAVPRDGGFALALDEVFANFPVALLREQQDDA